MAGSKTPLAIELRLLQVFLAVSSTGSMTAAAKLLGMSQSAVSQSLRELEDGIKVSLFIREHRPLQLTAAGNLLRERATGLIEQANQLPSLLQEIGSSSLPAIRLGLADSFAGTVGPLLVRELLRDAMQLTVYSGLSPSHGEALAHRAVDLIVSSDALYDMDGLERHLILSEPFIFIAPAEIVDDVRRLSIEQISARYPLIRYSARSHLGTQVERHLRYLNVRVPRVAEIDSSDTLVAMVASGCGWAITTPLCYLQGRAHARRAVPVRLLRSDFNRSLVLIARAGEYAELPRKVAKQSREILSGTIVPEIRRLIPWLKAEMIVPK